MGLMVIAMPTMTLMILMFLDWLYICSFSLKFVYLNSFPMAISLICLPIYKYKKRISIYIYIYTPRTRIRRQLLVARTIWKNLLPHVPLAVNVCRVHLDLRSVLGGSLINLGNSNVEILKCPKSPWIRLR